MTLRGRASTPRRGALRDLVRGEGRIERLVTEDGLRDLARWQDPGPVASLYLSMFDDRGSRRGPEPLSTAFRSLRRAALEAYRGYLANLTKPEARRLDARLEEIATVLGARDWVRDAARSLVVLAGEDDVRVFALAPRMGDRLVFDPDPYLTPLEVAVEEDRPLLVVEIEKEEGRLWAFRLGHRRDLAVTRADGPVADVDRSRPGKAERHRLTPLQWQLRAIARAADELFGSDRFEGLVLVGTDTVRPMLHEELPRALADRVFAEFPLIDPTDAERRIAAALADAKARDEELAAGDLGLHSSRGHLASGLEEVIEAANLFLVRRLIVVCDAARAGFVCRRHQHMSLEPGRCPYDDEELRPVADAGEELIHLAYLSGTERMLVTERRDLLEPYGGAAAVLHAPLPGRSA
jgi:hypothetical protein